MLVGKRLKVCRRSFVGGDDRLRGEEDGLRWGWGEWTLERGRQFVADKAWAALEMGSVDA